MLPADVQERDWLVAGPPESVERAARQPAKSLDPDELAERILDRSAVDGTPTVIHHRGRFMRWNGRVYEPLDRDEATDFIAGEVTRHAEFVKAEHVSNTQLHVRRRTRMRKDLQPGEWLADPPDGWPGGEAMAFPNGLVPLAPLEGGRPVLLPHTPRLFLTQTSAVPFDPGVAPPERWLRFLHHDLFRDRPDEVRTIRQYFGYHLLPDVSQQKAMQLMGPPRCGKGTILRTLGALLGHNAVAGTSLQDLGGRFGLQALLGKSALHIGDVRLGRGKDRTAVVQTLLSIIGQDVITADVKFRDPVTGPLPVKVTIASNELLELPDDSGALAARFLPIEFTESFLGKEDTHLAADLAAELPGILLWAVGGLLDLRASGRFHEPQRTVELRKEMFTLGSPVAAFVDECCVIGPDFEIPTEALRGRYTEWSKARGLPPADAGVFGKRLRAACPKVRPGQSRKHAAGRSDRASVYRGIALIAA